jgi:hypothetical protein
VSQLYLKEDSDQILSLFIWDIDDKSTEIIKFSNIALNYFSCNNFFFFYCLIAQDWCSFSLIQGCKLPLIHLQIKSEFSCRKPNYTNPLGHIKSHMANKIYCSSSGIHLWFYSTFEMLLYDVFRQWCFIISIDKLLHDGVEYLSIIFLPSLDLL